jgi:HSP20 family molecular chaperone IbpA
MPPPEWIVYGVLMAGGNALLYGAFASLKSFLALDLALCVAYGIPWQGREVKQCAVLYIAGEGVRGLARRIKAWQIHHGLEDATAPFRVLSAGIDLTNPSDIARLIQTGLDEGEAEGMPVKLIFIDTLARAMVGADENAAQDMGRAVRNTDELRGGLDAATVTVHHSGKDKERGMRGSTALPGAADTILSVERDEMNLVVTIEKQKEDEEGAPIKLVARKIALNGGEIVEGEPTSLVLVEGEGGDAASTRPSGRLSGDQQRALSVLNDAMASHGEPDMPGVPAGCRSVPEIWWRERFYDRCKPGADRKTKEKAYRRAADGLLDARLVALNRERVWLIHTQP